LDDVCNFPQGTDQKFLGKIKEVYGSHAHFNSTGGDEFTIKHYAGDVRYNIDGFCDKNKDLLFKDLVGLAEVTSSGFIQVRNESLLRLKWVSILIYSFFFNLGSVP
jgi:myosin heavy subunit